MNCPALKKFRDVKVKVTFLSHKRELHDIIFVHVNFSSLNERFDRQSGLPDLVDR